MLHMSFIVPPFPSNNPIVLGDMQEFCAAHYDIATHLKLLSMFLKRNVKCTLTAVNVHGPFEADVLLASHDARVVFRGNDPGPLKIWFVSFLQVYLASLGEARPGLASRQCVEASALIK